ncbi:L,D-transpeptidase [Pseudoxanthomonas winnipegensis]|uniref:L,D-transpeptidase n=1 Tax=Pseudoxanthomonas winnipegensis TaxID=2480810 RepID=UPI00257746FF|nr:L,D-transpeptidase [Pseudoxanthomonas winnipegensis]WJI14437.1 L,D-transpeptidase [Pseudoxanthomonas winnipegensis]
MRRYAKVLGLIALVPLLALAAVPFWGDRQSRPIDTAAADLKPGQWVWAGDDKGAGPMAVIVSLTEQRAYVYRNGILMAWSTVSTGKAGYETPTGVFTILQKDKDHRSNKYNSAPMPYQQRLTWDGVALHAGGLPGYPESHGCVHLPTGFAQKLFDASTMGMVVVVAEAGHSAADLVHPGALSPIDPSTGKDVDMPLLEDGQPWRWDPSRASKGPLSVVLSRTDRILFVYRDGVEIGRTRIKLGGPDLRSGTHAYVVKAGYVPPAAGSVTPTTPMPEWIGIGVPGSEDDAGAPLPEDLARQVVIPEAFKAQVLPLVQPGTVLVATDASVLPRTTGVHLQVIDADPPER